MYSNWVYELKNVLSRTLIYRLSGWGTDRSRKHSTIEQRHKIKISLIPTKKASSIHTCRLKSGAGVYPKGYLNILMMEGVVVVVRGWWEGGREGWKREFLNTLKKYLYNTAFPLSKIAKYAWPVWKCINYHYMHAALNLILCKLRSNIFKVSCPLVHKSTYSAKYFAYSIWLSNVWTTRNLTQMEPLIILLHWVLVWYCQVSLHVPTESIMWQCCSG